MTSKTIKVAVVTGANKGIGLDIVRSLCRHFGRDGVVYLTARNEGRGLAAVELLQREGLNPRLHLLDVTDQASINVLRNHLQKEHDGIDVLINNAGIGTPHHLPLYEKTRCVLQTNFFAVLAICRSLIPLVRPSGRIVNVGSTAGCVVFREHLDGEMKNRFRHVKEEQDIVSLMNEFLKIVNVASTTGYSIFREQLDEEMKNRFRQVKDEQDIVSLMNEYLKFCKEGTIEENGWPDRAYGIAKLGVIVLSKVQAKKLSEQEMTRDIRVNACCPGFVYTDMTAHLSADHFGGTRITTVEGADTPVFLALLPSGVEGPNGEFILRRKSYDFLNTDVTVAICE